MDTMKFIWICGHSLSFLISLLLLFAFWQDKISRLAGFYAIAPGINTVIVNVLPYWIDFDSMIIISAGIEFVFVALIIAFFRSYYRMRFAIPWILLILEVFRWAWLIGSIVIHPDSVLSNFGGDLFYFYFIVPFAILLFCVFINKSNTIKQVNN